MIIEELEERLLQAVTIINHLLNSPTEETIKIAQNFIEENGEDLNLLNNIFDK